MYTEKDYKNLLNKYEVTTEEKEKLKNLYLVFDEVFLSINDKKMKIEKIFKIGSINNFTAINGCNNIDYLLFFDVDNKINSSLISNAILNCLENLITFSILTMDIKGFVRNTKQLIVKFNEYNVVINISLNSEKENNEYYLSNDLIEIINEKYSYFKNTLKIIKGVVFEQKLNIDTYILIILLIYGLEKYFSMNKYENYMKCFCNSLDDFLNKKIVLLEDSMIIENKNPIYQVINPYTGLNITNNVNDVNIINYRKLKKHIEKFNEIIVIEKGSSTLTLDINPVYNEASNTYSWSYNIIERSVSSIGGSYKNNPIEYKTASLKGLFRGLKAILDLSNVNKNICINTTISNLLICVEKNISEQENNSRRKTIVKFIDENKLNIKWNVKK